MKSKNDKTNPFSSSVALAETNRPATRMLSSAVNTAQKIYNISGEMTKLGTPKDEQTNPTTNPRNARHRKYLRINFGVENMAEIHAILGLGHTIDCILALRLIRWR